MCVCVCVYLLIRGQRGEEGDDVALDVLQLQNFGELSQLGGGRTPHHRCVIRAQGAEMSGVGTRLKKH